MSMIRTVNAPALIKRLLLGVSIGALVLPAHADGLTHVEQTIFGMDCAPCAYGVEQGLKKLPGVTGVRVSLNEGRANIALSANSSTTLEGIRNVVRENGFTPKNARITVVGTLVRADGETWLEVPGSPRYRLAATSDAIETALRARPDGVSVTVKGEITEDSAEARRVEVTELTG